MITNSHAALGSYDKRSVFGPATQVLKKTKTLLRITQLDAILPNGLSRNILLTAIRDIWRNSLELSINSKSAKELISNQLKALDKDKGPEIYSIYALELESVTTIKTLQKCAVRCLKDAHSLLIHPLQKSNRGINGPTLLVSYSRPHSYSHITKDFKDVYLNTFVMKWTDLSERCSNHIYDGFSRNFTAEGHPQAFTIPKTHSIDLSNNCLEMCNLLSYDLDLDLAAQLSQNFLAITKTVCPNAQPQNDHILLTERLAGDNLVDFAKGKYEYLSQTQKDKLFNQFGQVAMLDVLLGNQDRLVTVGYDEELSGFQLKFSEDDLGSNLGNIMITWDGETEESSDSSESSVDPIVYTIDNGICPDLAEDEDDKDYLIFLQNLFSDPKMAEKLAEVATQSFSFALRVHCENQDDVEAALATFKPLTDDLKKFGQRVFEQGINEMIKLLHDKLIPAWYSETADPLKKHLLSIHPKLLQEVTERIKAFKFTSKLLCI